MNLHDPIDQENEARIVALTAQRDRLLAACTKADSLLIRARYSSKLKAICNYATEASEELQVAIREIKAAKEQSQ